MSFKNYLIVLLCCLLQESRSRHVSVSLNLSLALPDESRALSAAVLQRCMRETEISMAELHRFRESLLSNEPEIVVGSNEDNVAAVHVDQDEAAEREAATDDNDTDDVISSHYSTIGDYDSNSFLGVNERNDQSLHCFTYCLYQKLGLIKNDIFKEQELFNKLFTLIIEREKTPVKECMQLESDNKCETIYKMHLCYSRLKSMDAERRIREILEREEVKNEELDEAVDEAVDDKDSNTEDNLDVTMELDPKQNEIDRE